MVNEIVALLATASAQAMSLASYMFFKTGTWGLVFSGISMLMITRYLLSPLIGYGHSGASDKVKKAALFAVKGG